MIKDLETEISGFKSESMKQRKMLYTLEKEREKYGAEASDANAKFAAALEEASALEDPLLIPSRSQSTTPFIDRCRLGQVKLREMTILDLQKKISEGDVKLKLQQNLCRPPAPTVLFSCWMLLR